MRAEGRGVERSSGLGCAAEFDRGVPLALYPVEPWRHVPCLFCFMDLAGVEHRACRNSRQSSFMAEHITTIDRRIKAPAIPLAVRPVGPPVRTLLQNQGLRSFGDAEFVLTGAHRRGCGCRMNTSTVLRSELVIGGELDIAGCRVMREPARRKKISSWDMGECISGQRAIISGHARMNALCFGILRRRAHSDADDQE